METQQEIVSMMTRQWVNWYFTITTALILSINNYIYSDGNFNPERITYMKDIPEIPTYHCRRIDKEIELTGRMDDPAWELAEVINLVHTDSGESPEQTTEVRLLYSGTTLYIGFHCEDDYIWGTYEDHDSPIYLEECVEVFLNPAGNEHQYFEINVSPKNTVFDACILSNRINKRSDKNFSGLTDFNPAIMTRVYIEGNRGIPGEGKFWKVEYAIPFNELFGAPNMVPVPGDCWRANFYRIDAPEEGESRYYAWNPTGKIDFHLPWKFGILQFD